MDNIKNDIWLIIATCEELQLQHRTDAEKIANVIINMLGKRDLSAYFGINKNEVAGRVKQYVYNHEF